MHVIWEYEKLTCTYIRIVPENRCDLSPCGPCSQCREVNNQAVCSCLRSCIGSPPNCRAECTVNEECSSQLACINQKCVSPCPGICGTNAECRAINHSPICVCNPGMTGDPFTRCFPNTSKIKYLVIAPQIQVRLTTKLYHTKFYYLFIM